MPRSRSDDDVTEGTLRPADAVQDTAAEPADAVDADAGAISSPRLGVVGWLRWGWTQLTSMRTALVLLLLLAIAAVPGSIVPQRTADPNGVTQYFTDNPDLAPILDNLSLFDVYTSPWFSAIYILLFVSLVGCIIPRTKHHWKASRARPPRTPARLGRLDDHRETVVPLEAGDDGDALAAESIDLATEQLRKAGYRVERYDTRGSFSVSAERGYLRESGNLVFHASLVGVLLAVGIGGGFTYTGQTVLVEGQGFANSLINYTSFNPGRFVDPELLSPYSMTLDSFDVSYVPAGESGQGMAGDFAANVTTRLPGADAARGEVRVNHPLDLEGDRVYLMGNGYAPTIVIRDADGQEIWRDSVPFLPQDDNLTSLGVVKIADGFPEQLGLVGFFYPTGVELNTGALASSFGDLAYPILSLDVYEGDLGIDDGTPRSVYTLDTGGMTKLTGRGTDVESIELRPGQSAELPDGRGTIEFEDVSPEGATDLGQSVKRFASLSIHHDVAAPWVLVFASLATLGLLAALFVPRRRMWVKAAVAGDTVVIEYAGLARGEDPTLAAAVDAVAARHTDAVHGWRRAAKVG